MSSGVSRSLTPPASDGLGDRLADIAADRAASAAQIVHEASGLLRSWLAGRSESELSGEALELALAAFASDQGWRGPCALWLDSIRRTLAHAARTRRPARDVLEEELGHWLVDRDRDFHGELSERAAREAGPEDSIPWDGEPLSAGRRLPSRAELARRAAGEAARPGESAHAGESDRDVEAHPSIEAEIEHGDTVLVTAYSETVALALETAWRAGKDPAVLLGEGMPELDGRRTALRLSRAGIRTTLVYDAAVPSLVPRVDRVWLSTEAIGAGAFLARLGTRALIEECSRRSVPVRVLATSDKLVPGGVLRLPAWAEREGWRLWEDAPEGVRLETQIYETVPSALLELVGGFLTEVGPEAVSAMHVRALRVEAAPPGGGPAAHRPAGVI